MEKIEKIVMDLFQFLTENYVEAFFALPGIVGLALIVFMILCSLFQAIKETPISFLLIIWATSSIVYWAIKFPSNQ